MCVCVCAPRFLHSCLVDCICFAFKLKLNFQYASMYRSTHSTHIFMYSCAQANSLHAKSPFWSIFKLNFNPILLAPHNGYSIFNQYSHLCYLGIESFMRYKLQHSCVIYLITKCLAFRHMHTLRIRHVRHRMFNLMRIAMNDDELCENLGQIII